MNVHLCICWVCVCVHHPPHPSLIIQMSSTTSTQGVCIVASYISPSPSLPLLIRLVGIFLIFTILERVFRRSPFMIGGQAGVHHGRSRKQKTKDVSRKMILLFWGFENLITVCVCGQRELEEKLFLERERENCFLIYCLLPCDVVMIMMMTRVERMECVSVSRSNRA